MLQYSEIPVVAISETPDDITRLEIAQFSP